MLRVLATGKNDLLILAFAIVGKLHGGYGVATVADSEAQSMNDLVSNTPQTNIITTTAITLLNCN